jgi:hypothetical protein
VDDCRLQGVQDGVETEQSPAFLGTVPDERVIRHQSLIIFERSGTSEEKPLSLGIGIVEGSSPQVVEPV